MEFVLYEYHLIKGQKSPIFDGRYLQMTPQQFQQSELNKYFNTRSVVGDFHEKYFTYYFVVRNEYVVEIFSFSG